MSASPFVRVFLEEEKEQISAKITSVQSCGHYCRECPSVTFLNFFTPLKLEDELSNQPIRSPEAKFSIPNALIAAPAVSKYMKEDLH